MTNRHEVGLLFPGKKELKVVSNRLNNESFLDKAPEDVINKVKGQYKELEEKNDELKIDSNRFVS